MWFAGVNMFYTLYVFDESCPSVTEKDSFLSLVPPSEIESITDTHVRVKKGSRLNCEEKICIQPLDPVLRLMANAKSTTLFGVKGETMEECVSSLFRKQEDDKRKRRRRGKQRGEDGDWVSTKDLFRLGPPRPTPPFGI